MKSPPIPEHPPIRAFLPKPLFSCGARNYQPNIIIVQYHDSCVTFLFIPERFKVIRQKSFLSSANVDYEMVDCAQTPKLSSSVHSESRPEPQHFVFFCSYLFENKNKRNYFSLALNHQFETKKRGFHSVKMSERASFILSPTFPPPSFSHLSWPISLSLAPQTFSMNWSLLFHCSWLSSLFRFPTAIIILICQWAWRVV